MPTRKTLLVTGEIYHVLNRGVNFQSIFLDAWDYKRARNIFAFYQFMKPPIRFSFYNRLQDQEKENIWKKLKNDDQKLISPLAFCFMPNHFHFLIKQLHQDGISKCLANFQNSFTKYFNKRHNRSGHLFQGQFKAIRIETEEQLLHTSRYIHLNPHTAYTVKTAEELKQYPYSSFSEYLENKKNNICDNNTVLANFSSKEKYLQFVLDQKDYQRTLDQIKHLVLE